MNDYDCRCTGSDPFDSVPCEQAATEEDGLCDGCRRNECEEVRDFTLTALREAAKTNPSVARILERRGVA